MSIHTHVRIYICAHTYLFRHCWFKWILLNTATSNYTITAPLKTFSKQISPLYQLVLQCLIIYLSKILLTLSSNARITPSHKTTLRSAKCYTAEKRGLCGHRNKTIKIKVDLCWDRIYEKRTWYITKVSRALWDQQRLHSETLSKAEIILHFIAIKVSVHSLSFPKKRQEGHTSNFKTIGKSFTH